MSDIKKLAELIKPIKFAMLTTQDPHSGEIRSRPMTLQKTEFDGNLWFFASRTTEPVLDVAVNPRVNLSFADVKTNTYISIVGHGEIVNEFSKKQELWNPMMKAWFPDGLNDADLRLIKVSIETADYWDSPHAKVVQFVGLAKAILTGKRPGAELGHHGQVRVNASINDATNLTIRN